MTISTLDLFSLVAELIADEAPYFELYCIEDFISASVTDDYDEDCEIEYDPVCDVKGKDYCPRFEIESEDSIIPSIFSKHDLNVLKQSLTSANAHALSELSKTDISAQYRSELRSGMKDNDLLSQKISSFLSHIVQVEE